MASFYPNPDNENESWIEKPADDLGLNFRIWHVMFFCFSAVLIIVTFVCCCIKIRIPRTKQEIEADYQRKKIARKFREKLKCIENQTMNGIDLKKALELIQQEIEKERSEKKLPLQSDNSKPEGSTGAIKTQQLQKPLVDKLVTIMNSKGKYSNPQNV